MTQRDRNQDTGPADRPVSDGLSAGGSPKDAAPADTPQTLNAALLDAILAAVEQGAAGRLAVLLGPLHAADIADLLEQIGSGSREQLVQLWGDALDPETLSELSDGLLRDIVPLLSARQLARLTELETDDVVSIVEELDARQQEKVLETLSEADRAAVVSSLAYPEFSAGRLMQRELVTAPNHWTVGEIIDFMRAAEHLPDVFYDVVLVDPRIRPIGAVPLSRIMGNRRAMALLDLTHADFRTIHPEATQEDVAYDFAQYHMMSLPVVDEGGRLVGVITADDAMIAQGEEAEEDIKRLAGVGDEALTDRFWATARQRFPWLSANLCTAMLSALVISTFEDALQAIVALAVLMPVVASMGGNAGTQTLTVAVRALATRDLTAANMRRIVGREALVGLFNGLAFALLLAAIAGVWFGSAGLAAVLAMAMVVNLLVAGLAGILIPVGLDRLGADPALASGTFVTTMTDVVGFFTFLGLASLVLL
ncbi:MAG: magnesium transporter [Pseudomonadota bacterium]